MSLGSLATFNKQNRFFVRNQTINEGWGGDGGVSNFITPIFLSKGLLTPKNKKLIKGGSGSQFYENISQQICFL